ncbi:IST1-like protein [Nymphaea thermarum]|nr:IST1-like protein [Nymphaea thermarum]
MVSFHSEVLSSIGGKSRRMREKLDALLRRNFKTSKFKSLIGLAITRIGVLKNQRRARFSQSRKDVLELLKREQQESALLRVEHVIKEQNMLDAFILIEGFCHLLIERVSLIENQKTCPDELREAISSLIFVSSRCGELPELKEVRSIFTSRYGKEFTASALELRGGCEVSVTLIQKMSTKQPSLEARLQVLKEIAKEGDLQLNLEELSDLTVEGLGLNPKQSRGSADANQKEGRFKKKTSPDVDDSVKFEKDQLIAGSVNVKNYSDVEEAARAAFESAAYAAAAAKIAVELSRKESQGKGFDDPDDSSSEGKNVSDSDESEGYRTTRSKHAMESSEMNNLQHDEDFSYQPKDHPVIGQSPEKRKYAEKLKSRHERILSSSSTDSFEASQEEENFFVEKSPRVDGPSVISEEHHHQVKYGGKAGSKGSFDDDQSPDYDYGRNSRTENPYRYSTSKLQWQNSDVKAGPIQEEPNRLPQKGSNFVSVRTRPSTRQ